MTDMKHQNLPEVVVDLIDYPVLADSDAAIHLAR
jgi:hypothetical protein